MPLEKSKSNEARERNIEREIAAGKDPKQAAAIGYAVQRKAGGNDVPLTRPHGTPSGRVGDQGFVSRTPYTGSAEDKSGSTKNSRKQTGSHPTHKGGNF